MEEKPLFEEFFYSEALTSHPSHHHNCYQMLFVCEGDVEVQIGGASYAPDPGSALFISKLEEHAVRIRGSAYRRYILALTPAQLDELIPDALLQALFTRRMPSFCHAFGLKNQSENVQHMLDQVQHELETSDAFTKSRIRALLTLVLVACLRLRPMDLGYVSGETQNLMFLVRQYIDGHFAEPLTIGELAAAFYVSTSHLSHSFRFWFGLSPQQYLLKSRLSYARELLLTTDDSITRVSGKCGFGDVSNFIRSFKQAYKMPPNRYRIGKKAR